MKSFVTFSESNITYSEPKGPFKTIFVQVDGKPWGRIRKQVKTYQVISDVGHVFTNDKGWKSNTKPVNSVSTGKKLIADFMNEIMEAVDASKYESKDIRNDSGINKMKSSSDKQNKSRMGFKQHFKDNEFKWLKYRTQNAIKTDDWYDDQPEWGSDKSTAAAKKKTPGYQKEEVAGMNTGSIPNSAETAQGQKRKYSVLTRHYIEIDGKRKRIIK